MARLSEIRPAIEPAPAAVITAADGIVVEEFEDNDDFDESLNLLEDAHKAIRDVVANVRMSGWRQHTLTGLADEIRQFLDLFIEGEES